MSLQQCLKRGYGFLQKAFSKDGDPQRYGIRNPTFQNLFAPCHAQATSRSASIRLLPTVLISKHENSIHGNSNDFNLIYKRFYKYNREEGQDEMEAQFSVCFYSMAYRCECRRPFSQAGRGEPWGFLRWNFRSTGIRRGVCGFDGYQK